MPTARSVGRTDLPPAPEPELVALGDGLAMLAMNQSENDVALEFFNRALETNPEFIEARRYRAAHGLSFLIEIDGGIKKENAELVAAAGADVALGMAMGVGAARA